MCALSLRTRPDGPPGRNDEVADAQFPDRGTRFRASQMDVAPSIRSSSKTTARGGSAHAVSGDRDPPGVVVSRVGDEPPVGVHDLGAFQHAGQLRCPRRVTGGDDEWCDVGSLARMWTGLGMRMCSSRVGH